MLGHLRAAIRLMLALTLGAGMLTQALSADLPYAGAKSPGVRAGPPGPDWCPKTCTRKVWFIARDKAYSLTAAPAPPAPLPPDDPPPYPEPAPLPIPGPGRICAFQSSQRDVHTCTFRDTGPDCVPPVSVNLQVTTWEIKDLAPMACAAERFRPYAKPATKVFTRTSGDTLQDALCPIGTPCPQALRVGAFTTNFTSMALSGPSFLRMDKQGIVTGVLPTVSSRTEFKFSVEARNPVGAARHDFTLIVEPK